MITESNQLCNPKKDPKKIYVMDYNLKVMQEWTWFEFLDFLNNEIYDKVFSLDKKIIKAELKEYVTEWKSRIK
jgi:hypothetical protein